MKCNSKSHIGQEKDPRSSNGYHLHPTCVTPLETSDHLSHRHPENWENQIDEVYFLEILRAPVQIEERLDDVSIDKALAGLVLLVTGHGTGVKRGFVQFLQSCFSPLERSPD